MSLVSGCCLKLEKSDATVRIELVHCWHPTTQWLLYALYLCVTPAALGEEPGARVRTLQGHSGSVIAVAFSPGGKTLASGSKDRSIKLWDAQSGKLLRTLTGHTGRVESLAFAPDGKTLATGGGGGDTSVRLWDLTKK